MSAFENRSFEKAQVFALVTEIHFSSRREQKARDGFLLGIFRSGDNGPVPVTVPASPPQEKPRHWAAVHLALWGVALFMMLPALVAGQPMHSLDGHWGWRAMRFALENRPEGAVWTPQMGGAWPVALELALSPYYPLADLWLAAGYDRFFGLFVAAHLWLAGWGVFRWLRLFGVRDDLSLAAAAAFMLSPLLTGRLVLDTHLGLVAAAWMPHVFVSAHRWVSEKQLRFVFGLAAALSLMLLGGHPPNAVMFGFAAVAYGLVLAWLSGAFSLKTLGGFALAGLMTLGLCVAPLLDLKTLAAEGPRALRMGLDPASQGLPVEALLTLVLPGVWGRDYQGVGYLGRFFGSLNTLYIGVLWPVAALLRPACRQRPAELALLLTALGCGLMAVGLPSPLIVLMQKAGFPLSTLRLPVRWMFPVMLALLTFGALAVQQVWNRPVTLPRWLGRSVALVFAVGLLVAGFLLAAPQAVLKTALDWAMTDPARFAALDAAPLAAWRQTGLWLMGETLLFAALTALVLLCLKRGKTAVALGLSLLLSGVAAAPDLALSFRPREAPLPVPKQVKTTDRILPLVSRFNSPHDTAMGALDWFTLDTLGQLLMQRYTVAPIHGGVPHVGWQSLLLGTHQRVNDTTWDVKKPWLDFLMVRWVLTRDTPHPFCSRPHAPRYRAQTAMNMPPPRGLTRAFLCVDKSAIEAAGFEETPTPDERGGYRWWRNTTPGVGALWVGRFRPSADPLSDALKDPAGWLAHPTATPQDVKALKRFFVKGEAEATEASLRLHFRSADKATPAVSFSRSTAPGFLVLPLPYWRQWRVSTQGEKGLTPLKTFRAAGGLLGVVVPNNLGRINLDFHYGGAHRTWGMVVIWLVFLGLWCIAVIYRDKRKPAPFL